MADAISLKDLQAQLNAMKQELAATKTELANAKAKGSSMKVSAKGALSIYGLGRFPVTLYRGQWQRLLGMSDEIEQFILDHSALLKTKED